MKILFVLWLCVLGLLPPSVNGHLSSPQVENDENSVDGHLAARKGNSATTVSAISNEERLFLEVPNADAAKNNLRFLTHQPHVAGTEGDRIMATFVMQEFQKAGIPQVSIFDLQVLLNYPQMDHPPQVTLWDTSTDNINHNNQKSKEERKLIFRAKLSEDVLPEDETSDTVWRNHTFHGYSPSGKVVNAPMVYANYGRPQDFDNLEQAGVSVNGTVVIVRYGQCFRGLKVMNAQQRGAVAVVIYSDPAEDGYRQGAVYPDGPWKPPQGVQRGSVQFNSRCAGDPMRADPRYRQWFNASLQDICGVSSTKDLIPSIPSIPISYGDAKPLLQHIVEGPLARDVGGDSFCGGMANVTYRVGPSQQARLDLTVQNEDCIRNVSNVIGVIPGRLPPDKDMPILIGNHRDAWVYGAADPNSGTAALLEVVRGLGKLYTDHNWRPLRSIYFLSWSGEEYGLLGSTGWAELHQREPSITRALAYLNVDTAVSGDQLEADASPSLVPLWKKVLDDLFSSSSTTSFITNADGDNHADVRPRQLIRDTNTGWEWRALDGDDGEIKDDDKIGILGSGSDYTVFLDHFGIPSLDFKFTRESTYGQYHSIYDSFAWMELFGGKDGNPGSAFELMALSSKIWGLLTLRLASSDLVPVDVIALGSAVSRYVAAIKSQYDTVLDPELEHLKDAVTEYQEKAATLQLHCSTEAAAAARNQDYEMDMTELCNEKLGLAERAFLNPDGLPGRPWFKHVLQAPGMYLGYAAEAFPGIQQAMEAGNLPLAKQQVRIITELMEKAAKTLQL